MFGRLTDVRPIEAYSNPSLTSTCTCFVECLRFDGGESLWAHKRGIRRSPDIALKQKQATIHSPAERSLRIATTPCHSMAEETCSLLEGSGSERDTSSSNSDNPSSESNNPSPKSKRTNNQVRTQIKVRDAQGASSTAKKMPKVTPSKQMPTKSPE